MQPLEALLDLVLHDMTATGAPRPLVSFEPHGDGAVVVSLTGDTGWSMGFGLDTSEPDNHVLVALADHVFDAYIDLYRLPLPLVPSTTRPAVPTITDGTPSWTDPAHTTPWSCPIGSYGTADPAGPLHSVATKLCVRLTLAASSR